MYIVICYLCCVVLNLCCAIPAVSLHLEKVKTRNTNTNVNWGLNKHFWHFLLQERVSWSKIMIHIGWINLVLKNIRTKIVSLEQMSSFSLFSLNRILAKTLLYGGENIFVFTEHMICTSRQFQEVNLNFLLFNIFFLLESNLSFFLVIIILGTYKWNLNIYVLSLEISSSQLLLHSHNEVIMCLCIIQEPAGWFLSFLQ